MLYAFVVFHLSVDCPSHNWSWTGSYFDRLLGKLTKHFESSLLQIFVYLLRSLGRIKYLKVGVISAN